VVQVAAVAQAVAAAPEEEAAAAEDKNAGNAGSTEMEKHQALFEL
jgi:hypothetical protein